MSVYWPAMLLFLMVGTYWARVVRLVLKARRRGRDVNFAPQERLGRALRVVWYPVVLLWIVHPLLNAFASSPPALLRPFFHNAVVGWTCVALAAGALAGTMVCWKRMGKSWRMGIDPHDRSAPLIVSGPYAYVRHPIYALSSLLMLASVGVLPTPLMLVLAIVHLLLLQWEARREERHLLAAHGDTYATYRQSVGRFLPRLG
jgi:protein-S-isoprenylcysteine O-methyltransferase Ste14